MRGHFSRNAGLTALRIGRCRVHRRGGCRTHPLPLNIPPVLLVFDAAWVHRDRRSFTPLVAHVYRHRPGGHGASHRRSSHALVGRFRGLADGDAGRKNVQGKAGIFILKTGGFDNWDNFYEPAPLRCRLCRLVLSLLPGKEVHREGCTVMSNAESVKAFSCVGLFFVAPGGSVWVNLDPG